MFCFFFLITFPSLGIPVPTNDLFLFQNHWLWCPVYWEGMFCQISRVVSAIRLPQFLESFILISVKSHTIISCFSVTPVSLHMLKCNSVHALILSPYRMFFPQFLALWYNEVYSIVTLSTKSAFAICFSFQYLLRDILLIMPGFVLL
jgi:hypothetical protein